VHSAKRSAIGSLRHVLNLYSRMVVAIPYSSSTFPLSSALTLPVEFIVQGPNVALNLTVSMRATPTQTALP
jgi:hypothetical protein